MAAIDRNLVILHTPINESASDWAAVQRRIAATAPDIETRIVRNDEPDRDNEAWQATRRSLVFGVCPLWRYQPRAGKIYVGKPMSKMEEHERLAATAMPVPRTTRFRRDMALDPQDWGEFVIVKPMDGSFGRGVRLVRTSEALAMYDRIMPPGAPRSMVQSFIEHVDDAGRPTTHRVLVMFGRALYAIRSCWQEPRPPLGEIAASGGLIAANTSGRDRLRSLIDDPDIIALAERAATAVPEAPVLGVDVLRDPAGGLWVLELNSAGTVWHLSSETGRSRYPEAFRQSLYDQFGALDRAADLLIERTRSEAA